MKKSIFILLILQLVTSKALIIAQESDLDRGTIYPGYIVKLNGDTVHGFLLTLIFCLTSIKRIFIPILSTKKTGKNIQLKI